MRRPALAHLGLTAALMAPLVGSGCARGTSTGSSRSGRDAQEPLSGDQFEYLLRGELARERGDAAAATRAFLRARAGATDSPLLRARHVEALIENVEFDRARAQLERALTEFPGSPTLLLLAGELAFREGRDAEGDAYLRDATARAETSAPARAWAARLDASGRTDDAERVLESAAERFPDDVELRIARRERALAKGDLDAATELSLLPTPLPYAARLALAEVTFERGRPELTLRLLPLPPRSGAPLELWVRATIEAGDEARAAAHLVRCGPAALSTRWRYVELMIAAGAAPLVHAELDAELFAGAPLTPTRAYFTGLAALRAGDLERGVALLARVPLEDPLGAPARDALEEGLRLSGDTDLANELSTR